MIEIETFAQNKYVLAVTADVNFNHFMLQVVNYFYFWEWALVILNVEEQYQQRIQFEDFFVTDLSYQTAQKVLSADRDEQIRVLQDLSQNFPSRTR